MTKETETDPRDTKAHQDSQGRTLYLVLAEMASGAPALFGVPIQTVSYERGLYELQRIMDQDSGRRFIEVTNLQTLIRINLIKCPSCGNIVPANVPACPQCHMNMQSAEMQEAIRSGKTRVIQNIQYQLRALSDGTEDTWRIRPEHIMLYDLVPPDSPAYKKWVEATTEAEEIIRQAKSAIVLPTPQEQSIISMEAARKKMGK